jgi:hypothetical protein
MNPANSAITGKNRYHGYWPTLMEGTQETCPDSGEAGKLVISTYSHEFFFKLLNVKTEKTNKRPINAADDLEFYTIAPCL